MSEKRRLKRETPRRTAPIRNATMAFRAPGAKPREGKRGAAGIVEEAVDAAYRVFDEYMQRGRTAADRFSPQGAPGGPMRNDRPDMTWMAMRAWTDMAQMWMSWWAPWMSAYGMPPMPGMPRGAQGAWPAPPWAQPAPAGARVTPVVDVTADQPVEVSVELFGDAHGHLNAPPLQPVDGRDAPPLAAISIAHERAHDQRRVRVRVTIPHDQPAGEYAGPILSQDASEPRGVLRVVVRERRA